MVSVLLINVLVNVCVDMVDRLYTVHIEMNLSLLITNDQSWQAQEKI